MPDLRKEFPRGPGGGIGAPAQGSYDHVRSAHPQFRPVGRYVRPWRPYKWRGKGLEKLRRELDAAWRADLPAARRKAELKAQRALESDLSSAEGLAALRRALAAGMPTAPPTESG